MKTEIKVKLITYTPNAEKVIAEAAKLCYAKSDIDTLEENLTPEKVETFLEMLDELSHESPIEHVSFTFGIEGVSRALLAQITRHRIASFSVQSQRYVSKNSFDYIIPPEINAIPEAREEFIKAMEEDAKHYEFIHYKLWNKYYTDYLESGLGTKEADKKATKKANEDARFVLPNACDTKIIMTMNARSLRNFFRLRCCNRAQWEIRELACEMLKLVKEVCPTLFAMSGPSCINGKCPEREMSCGQSLQVKEKFLYK